MKKQTITLLALILVMLNTGVKAQNLVLNSSAESFNTSTMVPDNWTVVSGVWASHDAPGYVDTVHSGQYMFIESGGDQVGMLQQDVDVSAFTSTIDSGNKKFLFSAWEQSYNQQPEDAGIIVVQCLNAAKTQILSSWTSDTLTTVLVWAQTLHNFRVPVGTRYVRIQLISYRNNGSDNDGYFDDISLTSSTSNLAVGAVVNADVFKIAPNPASNNIIISLKTAGNYHLRIMNVTGKLMIKKDINQSGNVDISSLPAGNYFVQVLSDDYSTDQKSQFVKL